MIYKVHKVKCLLYILYYLYKIIECHIFNSCLNITYYVYTSNTKQFSIFNKEISILNYIIYKTYYKHINIG